MSHVHWPTHLTNFDLVAEKEHMKDADFRYFRRQLFHISLTQILSSLQLAMSEPEVVKCADGFYRCVIYGLGPYIADYPEQVLISGIVQGWCPRYSPTKWHRALHSSYWLRPFSNIAGVPHTRTLLKLQGSQGQRGTQMTSKRYSDWEICGTYTGLLVRLR